MIDADKRSSKSYKTGAATWDNLTETSSSQEPEIPDTILMNLLHCGGLLCHFGGYFEEMSPSVLAVLLQQLLFDRRRRRSRVSILTAIRCPLQVHYDPWNPTFAIANRVP